MKATTTVKPTKKRPQENRKPLNWFNYK